MTRTMLPLILTTTNSILPKISCEMEAPRVISGFKRVAWPELRRLPLITSAKKLPVGIEQVRQDIEREAVSITRKHGLQFEDEEQHSGPQMEMRGVPEKPSTGLPTILIFAPWSTEKQRDWETAAQEMTVFLADLSRVCSFSESDIHVEIMAPELVSVDPPAGWGHVKVAKSAPGISGNEMNEWKKYMNPAKRDRQWGSGYKAQMNEYGWRVKKTGSKRGSFVPKSKEHW
ncbi:hypothetical protein H9Q70_012768 [Fusarium xylarioides]|nr:hypothetical protein H9Q70_012768 [Fusarium xylarioides]